MIIATIINIGKIQPFPSLHHIACPIWGLEHKTQIPFNGACALVSEGKWNASHIKEIGTMGMKISATAFSKNAYKVHAYGFVQIFWIFSLNCNSKHLD